MTTEPRQEAERILHEQPCYEFNEQLDEDGRVIGASNRPNPKLVNALAAAIEETGAEDAVERLRNNPRRHGKRSATTRLANARAARREALSALREDET